MRPDAPTPAERSRRERSVGRVRTAAIVITALLVAGLTGLWIDRKPIATGYIDRSFARAGVPAQYALVELAPGHQRLTHVVIGDPAHPDLVADWIETETRIGFDGPYLVGLRLGRVRLRAALLDGRLSLGTIDRLLPTASGKPFTLPSVDVSVADGRIRLATAMGDVGIKLSGQGRLSDGFRGNVAAVSGRLATGGCAGTSLATLLQVTTRAGKPSIAGPVRLAAIDCHGVRVDAPMADLRATLSGDLMHWQGQAMLASRSVRASGYSAAGANGAVSFSGDAAMTQGRVSATLVEPRVAAGHAGALGVAGAYRIGPTSVFDGSMRIDHAELADAPVARLIHVAAAASGTPVGPLATTLASGIAAATRDLSGEANVSAAVADGEGAVKIASARLSSASGARLALSGCDGVQVGWPRRDITIDTDLALAGGGLPAIRASLRQARPGTPIRGVARIAPYMAGNARIALTPVTFTASPAGAMVATRLTLSGPLPGGGIDALTLPVVMRWNASGVVVNDRCIPATFDRLALAGLRLGATRLALCPVDGALLRFAGGRIGGGMALNGVRLVGSLSGSPLALTAGTAALQLADRDFSLTDVHALLGPTDRQTRLDVARLTGSVARRSRGGFEGGGGQIANVPLVLSGAAGEWEMADGNLSLHGALGVADAAANGRFKPLSARDVTLTLASGRIDAHGVLHEPTTGTKVADVAIRHDLGRSEGHADLSVPGLAFTKVFQPELLTPLTYGVIADVRGNVIGEGHIIWSPADVTSTGRFRTGDLDLAAAFGPVSGVAGEILFTDLLSLQSAPGQVATVRSINPGIAVTDGRIVYQTLPGARVRVEGARWPFAGGTLTLDPTLLDFAVTAERRMTFHVDGAAADRFLDQFDFKNLDATGIFDGVLPIVFDADGGRIENGKLAVRQGGGGIAYVGDLTQKDLGFWGNLAFQTLKSLRYRSLSITMNGPLSGEMVTAVRFAGVSQGEGAKSNFLIRRLQRLPFVFNVTIRAPFRGLLDSAASFYDPKRLIARNLPALLDEQDKTAVPPIQPPASRTVP